MAKEVEIGFGTLFSVKNFPERTDVVINIHPDGAFDAAELCQDKNKNLYLGTPGSSGSEYIEETTGRMTLADVVKAAKLGSNTGFYRVTPELIQSLVLNSKKPSQKIGLKE